VKSNPTYGLEKRVRHKSATKADAHNIMTNNNTKRTIDDIYNINSSRIIQSEHIMLFPTPDQTTLTKRTLSLPEPAPLKKKSTNPFRWVRPKGENDPPKKPLSSYNIFFLLERERIVRGDTDEGIIYTLEDVQNIVKLQKWNHHHRKRQHRKTHGKISFHDLSRVVADKWRNLDEKYKDVFYDQAAIEKTLYKKEMDQWIMKQMNQKQYNTNTTVSKIKIDKQNSTRKATADKVNSSPDICGLNTNVDKVKQLSNQEVFHLLQYFDIVPTDDDMVVSSNSLSDVTSDNTNTPCHNNNNSSNNDIDDDLYNWKIDYNGPLWYDNARNCSEEFALQMIDAMNNYCNTTLTTPYDRAITL
jgi:HMG (high mobility group) box